MVDRECVCAICMRYVSSLPLQRCSSGPGGRALESRSMHVHGGADPPPPPPLQAAAALSAGELTLMVQVQESWQADQPS